MSIWILCLTNLVREVIQYETHLQSYEVLIRLMATSLIRLAAGIVLAVLRHQQFVDASNYQGSRIVVL
jgi:hypothetical protein